MSPAILYYDGHCALCSAVVQALLRLDTEARFRYAPLQSAFAKTRFAPTALDPLALDSVVLEHDGEFFQKSAAAFEVSRLLGWPYRVLTAFQVLPQGFLDGVYDRIARGRYRVFGRHEACWLPRPEWRDRFLGEA